MGYNGFVMCNDRRLPCNGITSMLAEGVEDRTKSLVGQSIARG